MKPTEKFHIWTQRSSVLKSAFRQLSTDTGRYLSLALHHQQNAKRSAASALLSRARTIVSDEEEKNKEIEVVMKSLQNNNYPFPFIKRQLLCLSTKSKETEKNSNVMKKQPQQ